MISSGNKAAHVAWRFVQQPSGCCLTKSKPQNVRFVCKIESWYNHWIYVCSILPYAKKRTLKRSDAGKPAPLLFVAIFSFPSAFLFLLLQKSCPLPLLLAVIAPKTQFFQILSLARFYGLFPFFWSITMHQRS